MTDTLRHMAGVCERVAKIWETRFVCAVCTVTPRSILPSPSCVPFCFVIVLCLYPHSKLWTANFARSTVRIHPPSTP